MDLLLPAFVDEEGGGTAHAWWQEMQLVPACNVFGATMLSPGQQVASPLISHETLPGVLQLLHRYRRLQVAMRGLGFQHDTLVGQMMARKAREVRKSKASSIGMSSAELARLAEDTRNDMQETFHQITNELEDMDWRLSQKDGPIHGEISRIIAGITEDDLVQTKGAKQVRLELDPAILNACRQPLESRVREQLLDDQLLLQRRLEEAEHQVNHVREEANLDMAPVGLNQANDSDLSNAIAVRLEEPFSWRGQFQKRGFVQRLGAGRRALFLVLMSVSIGGTILGASGMRQAWWVGAALIGAFFFATIATYRKWREEDAETLDNELQRCRDSLTMHTNRMVQDVIQEKKRFIKKKPR